MPSLKLSHGHTMYYAEYGNPRGTPAVYLHGGPGSGSKPDHATYFNLKRQRVIIYDQRGCGQSKPLGDITHNTTQLLIDDLETLRTHLNIERWQVVGFSWGSALALAYAQAHPQRVLGIVTGAVFLGTQAELDWMTQPTGAAQYYPAAYAAARQLAATPAAILKALTGRDKKHAAQVARAWTRFDALTMELEPDEAAIKAAMKTDKHLATRMKVMWHYFANACFLKPDQLLKNAQKLKSIPVHIIQGHYDMCTPPAAALALHKALPGSQLTMVTLAGHRATPEVKKLRGRAIAAQLAKFK